MLMKISEARNSIRVALNKFNANKLNYWNANGSLYQKFELPSGTQLLLITTPHFDGESIEVEWKWILN